MQIYVNGQYTGQKQDGSRQAPFGTISQAAQIARPGDEVVVMPGVYREAVDPPRGGTDDALRIVYRSFLPRGAVISGAEQVTGWAPLGEGLYQAVWRGQEPLSPSAALYLNGTALARAADEETLQAPLSEGQSPFRYLARAGEDGLTLTVFLPGLDPNEEDLELSVRPFCFRPSGEGRDHVTLSGFRLTMAAPPPFDPCRAEAGLAGPGRAKGWVIEDCEISLSQGCGLSLGRAERPSPVPDDPERRESEALFEALREGWSRENTGGHVIRGCEIRDCAGPGIGGSFYGAFSRIEGCRIHHCETGVFLNAGVDAAVIGCQVHHCGTGALLRAAQGVRVSACAFHHCGPGGDFSLQMSHGPVLFDHCLFLSAGGCAARADGWAVSHCLMNGPVRTEEAGPAAAPYFLPHSTAPAGMAPVRAGAGIFRLDLTADCGPSGTAELLGADGRWAVRLSGFDCRPAQTAEEAALPARAGVSGLPFENPDGTPVSLDHDYFGQPTDGLTPGPIASGADGAFILQPGQTHE